MVRILTHWEDLDIVSRLMADSDTFTALAGQVVDVDANGKVSPLATDGTQPSNPVFLLNSVTESQYESHDTAAGRVSTFEGNGVRVMGDTDVVVSDTYVAGQELIADAGETNTGKLRAGSSETGMVVAKVISFDGDNVVFRTVEPYEVTFS